jgi:hypothetical protein
MICCRGEKMEPSQLVQPPEDHSRQCFDTLGTLMGSELSRQLTDPGLVTSDSLRVVA